MTFEEMFPSLKKKIMTSLMFMSTEIGDDGDIIRRHDVEKHCLDKKKVKEFVHYVYKGIEDCNMSREMFLDKVKELGL